MRVSWLYGRGAMALAVALVLICSTGSLPGPPRAVAAPAGAVVVGDVAPGTGQAKVALLVRHVGGGAPGWVSGGGGGVRSAYVTVRSGGGGAPVTPKQVRRVVKKQGLKVDRGFNRVKPIVKRYRSSTARNNRHNLSMRTG